MDIIYKRTAKGEDELKKRTYKLDHSLRFVLIMIDGNATTENIISRSSEQWNPAESIFQLESNGFIENIDDTVQINSEDEIVRQNLIALIRKQIPNNTKVLNKIRKASLNKADLTKAIDSSCIFIRLTVSEKIALQLKKDLHNILDRSFSIESK